MKRTKIVCTIGPASHDRHVLEEMIKNGMNVCRLNFSHGSYDDHRKMVRAIRAVSRALGKEVSLLQDLQGPRIRLGELPKEGVEVSKGDKVALVAERGMGTKEIRGYRAIPIQYPYLYRDVRQGNVIVIEDGTKKFIVDRVTKEIIHCTVEVGGVLKSHKGLNVPGVTLKAAVITDKDKRDLAFGISQGVDYIALSFVKDASDIKKLRSLIKRVKGARSLPGIIAKIERQEALDNLEQIIDAVDGIMVARGDLGIEVPSQRVPVLQKDIIQKCLSAGKPVIVATQMLDSMINNPQPTRAEVSDVANAVIDHADAVMLSGESAVGKYPGETVAMMSRIIEETEQSKYDDMSCFSRSREDIGSFISQCACGAVKTLQAASIAVFTGSGSSARLIARNRPEVPIIVLTPRLDVLRQLLLVWGVQPFLLKKPSSLEDALNKTVRFLKKKGLAKTGEKVVFLYGTNGRKEGMDVLKIVEI